jgi:large subunit ribosomal protein L5
MNKMHLWQEHILKKDYVYKLQVTNILSIPKLNKVILNICMNDAINDSKQILLSITALELITNQKPIIYRSKKSIAAFKLKKNTIIGSNLILRKRNMHDFLNLFIYFVLPKLVTFKSSHPKTVGVINSLSIGIFDLINFPQLNDNTIRFQKKLGATFTFIGKSDFKNINLMLNSYQIPTSSLNLKK